MAFGLFVGKLLANYTGGRHIGGTERMFSSFQNNKSAFSYIWFLYSHVIRPINLDVNFRFCFAQPKTDVFCVCISSVRSFPSYMHEHGIILYLRSYGRTIELTDGIFFCFIVIFVRLTGNEGIVNLNLNAQKTLTQVRFVVVLGDLMQSVAHAQSIAISISRWSTFHDHNNTCRCDGWCPWKLDDAATNSIKRSWTSILPWHAKQNKTKKYVYSDLFFEREREREEGETYLRMDWSADESYASRAWLMTRKRYRRNRPETLFFFLLLLGKVQWVL